MTTKESSTPRQRLAELAAHLRKASSPYFATNAIAAGAAAAIPPVVQCGVTTLTTGPDVMMAEAAAVLETLAQSVASESAEKPVMDHRGPSYWEGYSDGKRDAELNAEALPSASGEHEPRGSYESGWNEAIQRALLACEGEQAKYNQPGNESKAVRGAIEYALNAIRALKVTS